MMNSFTLQAGLKKYRVVGMNVILHSSANAPWQTIPCEWFGSAVEPPFEFRFHLTETELVFSARRRTPALLHPEAQEGKFQELLWKYDTAEFFIVSPGQERYLEFNLAPNGAWWSAVFTDPRVVDPTVPAVPAGVIARGHADAAGWECEARLPLASLAEMGLTPATAPCRIAAAAILNSPEQIFLTTATDTSGKPDFHHPWHWDVAQRA